VPSQLSQPLRCGDGGLLTSTGVDACWVPVVFTYVDASDEKAAALTLWIACAKPAMSAVSRHQPVFFGAVIRSASSEQ